MHIACSCDDFCSLKTLIAGEDVVDKTVSDKEENLEPGLEDIEQAMSRLRLMIGRRIIGRMALRDVAPDLEISHLDVIEAVNRIGCKGEATVGAIAEMMRIDPSRGSRLVSELVQRGFLRRSVSQEDARRTIVELTDLAREHFRKAAKVKRAVIRNIVADWSPEDIERFGVLYSRFVERFENILRNNDN